MDNFSDLLGRIAGRRILVIGDVMLDRYLWGDSTRISPEAPVPVVHIARESSTVGGAANVANNIAALGAGVEVVGVVGADERGALLRQHLARAGIDFDERFVRPGAPTITKTRVIVRNQQLCRLDFEDKREAYQLDLHDQALIAGIEAKIGRADAVILSDYAKGVLTTRLVELVSQWAGPGGKFVALDPKPASGIRFRELDLITPNRKEAVELSELKGLSEADLPDERVCSAIWERYRPKNLVITLGADGMLISAHGRVTKKIDTAARQVYDVSGAGDTVIAALTLALTSGASLENAAHFANAAAGVVVGKLGTATVTPAELLDYINHQ